MAAGREPSNIAGPNGERIPRREIESAIAALYKLEARCETCNRIDCNRLQLAIEKHDTLRPEYPGSGSVGMSGA